MNRDDIWMLFGLYVMGVVAVATLVIMWLLGWLR